MTFDELPGQVGILSDKLDLLTHLVRNHFNAGKPESRTLTIDEVCVLTNYKKNTIYQYVNRGTIPYHKPVHGGRKLIFIREEIMKWLQSERKTIESEADKREMLASGGK